MSIWIKDVCNQVLEKAAAKIDDLKHWRGVYMNPHLMNEQMVYKSGTGRHVDTPTLFLHPDYNNPSDGLVMLCHNFVNCRIENVRNGNYSMCEHPKTFCFYGNAEKKIPDTCGKSFPHLNTNEHFSNIRPGSIICMAFLAVMCMDHKPENVDNLTGITAYRNCSRAENQ